MRSYLLAGLAATALLAASAWATVSLRRSRHVWDHFDVVKHGILYRSGELRPDQLSQAVRTYGIRTVVDFRTPMEGAAEERTQVRSLGVDYLNLPMPGDGLGRAEQFREVLKVLDDPERRPVLIHCARGTCRTGAATALYRYERDGWTPEDVGAELRRQVYRDGLLPGYVYEMVRDRPFAELFQPSVILDRNRPEEGEPEQEATDAR
jgi:protein tyrosine/serine phosphatase